MNISTGKFYFLKDEFYDKFPDCNLMGNKEADDVGEHGRPCFYCYEYKKLLWMIPISSKINKYHELYAAKKQRYPDYDGIRFGFVNGKERAFLIQNICPTLPKYINRVYQIERGTVDVEIDGDLNQALNRIVRKVIRLYEKNIKIVLTDLDKILPVLKAEIENDI